MTGTDRNAEFELAELARRLANLVRVGTIQEVDASTARVRVQYAETGGGPVLTGWLPWITARAGGDRSWWAPEVAEQVLLLAPSGELAQAVVLPALYRQAYPAPESDPDKQTRVYSDGAIVEYDRAAHYLRAVLPGGGTAELVADGGVPVVGDVTVTGKITATANIESQQEVVDKTSSMHTMRDAYNNHAHSPAGPGPRM